MTDATLTPAPSSMPSPSWRSVSRRLASALRIVPAWTVLAALLLSTRFLAQPFVWNNYPLNDIAEGWFAVFIDRLIVTSCIAIMITVAVATTPSTSHPIVRGSAVAFAIAAGAVVGQAILVAGDRAFVGPGISPLLLHATRWAVIAVALATVHVLYRRSRLAQIAIDEASTAAARVERQAVEARLQLLRAQIEPHFLFNTLATIRRLHRSDRGEGAAMLANFIDYLRASTPRAAHERATIADELALVRAYLGLVGVRMSGRLSWTVDADPALLTHRFPAFALSTLVENAIKHGIEPADAGGTVTVTVVRVAAFVEARVVDTGVGLGVVGSGSGIGLSNTRARLLSLHGRGASLELGHHRPTGVRATIRLPFEGGAA